MEIGTDWDTAVDFSGLETYAWLPQPDRGEGEPRADNTLLAARVERAVDAELAEKGYEKAESAPDFLVTYHATLDRKLEFHTVHTGFGYGAGYWGWGLGGETYAHTYDEGTLILDVVDPETMELKWRGWATAEVYPAATPEEREQRVREAVHRMLERFPPQPPQPRD